MSQVGIPADTKHSPLGQRPGARARSGRPRGTCGPVRAALARALAAGLSGPLDVLAAHTGWPPEQVRKAVKEMRRAGELGMPARQASGQRGQPQGVYAVGQPKQHLDVLAFASTAWR